MNATCSSEAKSVAALRFRALCAILLAALALTGCTGATNTGNGPYAPSGLGRGKSVDGLLVGHRLLAAGEPELALNAYYRAVAEKGLTVDALSAIGSANLRLGRLGQAEKILRDAIKLDESFIPAWNNLGVTLMEARKVPEAIEIFRRAFALDSGVTPEIRDNLSLALETQKKLRYGGSQDEVITNFALVRRGNGEYLLLSAP